MSSNHLKPCLKPFTHSSLYIAPFTIPDFPRDSCENLINAASMLIGQPTDCLLSPSPTPSSQARRLKKKVRFAMERNQTIHFLDPSTDDEESSDESSDDREQKGIIQSTCERGWMLDEEIGEWIVPDPEECAVRGVFNAERMFESNKTFYFSKFLDGESITMGALGDYETCPDNHPEGHPRDLGESEDSFEGIFDCSEESEGGDEMERARSQLT